MKGRLLGFMLIQRAQAAGQMERCKRLNDY